VKRFLSEVWSLLRPPTDWPGIKRRLLQLAAWGILVGIVGFIVAASGVMPIKASSGHWPITAWFLNFSMERSVATHSAPIKAPHLDQPGWVQRGAAHYHTACRPCHGSPQVPRPRIANAMTPHPPYLPPVIPEYGSEDLFYIVKHGVKFTGMPSWPAQKRDDEVWAMTAFLREYASLDAAEYDRLIHGPAVENVEAAPIESLSETDVTPKLVIDICGRCHGQRGQGRAPGAFPKLAGQKPEYVELALKAYRDGVRYSGIMEPVAAGLTDEEMSAVAEYYSRMPPALGTDDADADLQKSAERGARIASEGIPDDSVPACAHCHGPGDEPRNPHYPLLAGQDPYYIEQQLTLFQKRHRGGTEFAELMHPVADKLKPEQMRDVAAYYSSLPTSEEPAGD
jgi:cytochrome c553